MSYIYTAGLKVIVEGELTALEKTATVYAFDFQTGDALTSPAPSITSVTTGVYRLAVVANPLTDVLFIFVPDEDDKDKIGQEALMHQKMYHVANDTLAMTKDLKLLISEIAPTVFGFIASYASSDFPEIEVSGTPFWEVNGTYRFTGWFQDTKPIYLNPHCIMAFDGAWYIESLGNYKFLFYYSTDDVATPDLCTTWLVGDDGEAPVPTVTKGEPSLYEQLKAMRGAGWTGDESLEDIMAAIEAIDGGGLDAADVRNAIGMATANLDTQLSGIKTDTGKLPASPAGVGAAMTLTSAYDAAKTAASQSSVNAIPTTPLLAGNYTAPDNAGITAIKAKTDKIPNTPAEAGEYTSALTAIKGKTDNLPVSPAPAGEYDSQLDAKISSRLAGDAYTAPDNAGITDIKAKTDKIPNSPAEAGEYTSALMDIQTDLDNPGQYKADVSGLATSSALSTVSGKVDAVKVQTDKIPNSPAPAGEYDTQLDATISSRLASASYTAPDNAKIANIETAVGNLNDITVGDILNGAVDGAITVQETLQIIGGVVAGLLSADSNTVTFRNLADTKDIVTATVDEHGNRLVIEYDLT